MAGLGVLRLPMDLKEQLPISAKPLRLMLPSVIFSSSWAPARAEDTGVEATPGALLVDWVLVDRVIGVYWGCLDSWVVWREVLGACWKVGVGRVYCCCE